MFVGSLSVLDPVDEMSRSVVVLFVGLLGLVLAGSLVTRVEAVEDGEKCCTQDCLLLLLSV